MRRLGLAVLLSMALPALVGCGGGRVRLQMGGLTSDVVPAMAENAAAMQCDLRRGLGRVALRCPGVAYPDQTVDMVIYNTGRVECVARRDYEDDCPLVAESLLSRQ